MLNQLLKYCHKFWNAIGFEFGTEIIEGESKMQKCDILVRNVRVLTPQYDIADDQYIAICDNKIVAVGNDSQCLFASDTERIVSPIYLYYTFHPYDCNLYRYVPSSWLPLKIAWISSSIAPTDMDS